jgi:DNA invertase Pin-like site-specific DNA recombinase
MILRVALYARYSTDLQSTSSVDDQLRLCRDRAEREGWEVRQVFFDAALSGASSFRPGYQALLAAAKSGEFEIVLAEALDRLSRDQEDIAGLFKRLQFAGVRLVTLAEGDVSELHIGLKGTMNALFIKDLAAKTHRGLRGRVAAGKSAGGISYGYKPVRQIDARGEPVRGDRIIDEAESAVVGRIFQMFSEGHSPVSIAKTLNAEAIPGPGGRPWRDTAIRGHAIRGTGILRNELYIGRLVWNRMRFTKDPSTGKRISRMNTPDVWVSEEVPHLRIIDQHLWTRVQSRLAVMRETAGANKPDRPKFWLNRRAQHILTGKVFCASCGRVMAATGKDYLACNAARKQGICQNTACIRRPVLEATVIDALRANLMQPDDVKEFITAFTVEWNQLAADASAQQAHDDATLANVQRKINRLIDAISEGIRTPDIKEKLDALSVQKTALQGRAANRQAPMPAMHPNLAELYRSKVANLQDTLNASPDNTEVLGNRCEYPTSRGGLKC